MSLYDAMFAQYGVKIAQVGYIGETNSLSLSTRDHVTEATTTEICICGCRCW